MRKVVPRGHQSQLIAFLAGSLIQADFGVGLWSSDPTPIEVLHQQEREGDQLFFHLLKDYIIYLILQ